MSLATKYRITHNYVLHDTPLPAVNQFKYLGITLQNNLKWDKHVSAVVSKASQTLGFLKRNFKMASQKIRELAYCTMIRPQVEYAISVWSPWLLQQGLKDCNIEVQDLCQETISKLLVQVID